MIRGSFRFLGLALAAAAALSLAGCSGMVSDGIPAKARQPLKVETVEALGRIQASASSAMLIRVFKESREFEVWKQVGGGPFKLLKTYEICAYSGGLGPKVKEGDRQAPEGFYNITPGLMNPRSNYFLAFNTGFPNKYDRAWGRTGSDLMVHGDCSSSGCYAMTDAGIAEVYALARESFAGGNAVIQMQIFPFRMTAQNLAAHAQDPNMPFWLELKDGHDRFELSRRPPSWDVCDKKYVFDLKSADGTPLDPVAACPARGDDPLRTALAEKQAADAAALKVELASAAGAPAAPAGAPGGA